MKNACFWSLVALVAIALCLETAKGQQLKPKRKVHETGSRIIHDHICGDQIVLQYHNWCSRGIRKRRSALMDEHEALSFLHHRSPRSTGTDVVEECCTEGCAIEEILEYC